WVLAVGNPFGLGGTVTTGIISARSRDIHAGPFDDFLQIDASINRGDSGGPTFNLAGEVIGINSAIYSPNGGSVGLGFAIPADDVNGVVVMDVTEDGPAAKQGLRQGDIIEQVARSKVSDPSEVDKAVQQALSAKKSAVLLLVNRQGDEVFLAIKVGKA